MHTKADDLQAFLAVARDQSFTKAAAKIGVTPSALSHRMKALEERLGLRLLARTTRNVAPTEAGARLMQSLTPLFDQIAAEVEALGELRDKPAGTIRITCTDDQIEVCLRSKLAEFLRNYQMHDADGFAQRYASIKASLHNTFFQSRHAMAEGRGVNPQSCRTNRLLVRS